MKYSEWEGDLYSYLVQLDDQYLNELLLDMTKTNIKNCNYYYEIIIDKLLIMGVEIEDVENIKNNINELNFLFETESGR